MFRVLQRDVYRRLNSAWFVFTGMKPWTRGYSEYKAVSINKVLENGSFNSKQLATGYGFRLDERIVEYPWFMSRLPAGVGNLLDAGSVLNFDYILERPVLKSKNIFISTLAPEPLCYWQKRISYVYEDLRDSCFKDGYFDWIASLSTIEHIGLDNTMLYTTEVAKKENAGDSYLQAIKEYRRMLKPGGILYLSFPFGRHENHGWFQIFDAPMVDRVIETFAPHRAEEFHFRYEAEGWRVSSREESKHATYFDIHTQKVHASDFAAASRAIVCLELVK